MAKAKRYKEGKDGKLTQVGLTSGKATAPTANYASKEGPPTTPIVYLGTDNPDGSYTGTVDYYEDDDITKPQKKTFSSKEEMSSFSPTVFSSSSINDNVIPQLNARASYLPTFGAAGGDPMLDAGYVGGEDFGSNDFNIDDILGTSKDKKKKKRSGIDLEKWQGKEGTNFMMPSGYWEQAYGESAPVMKELANMKRTSDQYFRSQVDSVENNYNRLQQMQQTANAQGLAQVQQALNLGGSSRYAPLSSAGLASAQQNYGIQKLADLASQEQMAVAEIKQAQQESDYERMEQKFEVLDGIREEKTAALEETNLRMAQASRDLQIAELVEGGVTNPVQLLKKLNSQGGSFTLEEVTEGLKNLTSTDGNNMDELLSVTEAKTLGVPFGTTKGEAFGISAKTSTLDDMNPAQQAAMFKLADDYSAQSKEFFTVQNAYERVKSASKNPSAAGDLALIFSFMKMLDPTSVVREQEFANAQNAAGVPERIRAMYNNVVDGERLTKNTRADFLAQAKSQFESQKNVQKQRNDTYAKRAGSLGIPADYVVQPIDEIDSRTPQEKLQTLYEESPDNQALIEEILSNEPDIQVEDIIDLLEKGPVSLQAERLADAIAYVESGNKQVKGASGEFGAFQFMPSTWVAISKEITGKALPQTPENERKVAAKKIENLLALGKSPEEVALIWNTSLGGTEEPRRISGTNKQGVKYDSVAYANKVLSALNS